MKIGFDARMIKHAGIGQYIECLLPELIKQAPQDEFILFGPIKDLESLAYAKNVRTIKWEMPIYSLNEQIFLPYDKEKLDLLHIPHFNIPLSYKGKTVVTIHDLIYLLFPRSLSFLFARKYVFFLMKNILEKASCVISVSQNTKEDLVKNFGSTYSEKIKVIHEAGSISFKKIDDVAQLVSVKEKYNLPEDFILYVGSIKPHKNVSTLIKVHEKLKSWDMPHQLVIVGKWDKKEDRLKGFIDNKNVHYLGEVSRDDLIKLYNLAKLVLHISLYEGFGLTVLEAMSSGTPVIVSKSSSLQEVAGEAALVVPPLDVGQIANTVYNVLTNQNLRFGMINAGFDQAKKFSWEKTAQETLKLYRSVVGHP